MKMNASGTIYAYQPMYDISLSPRPGFFSPKPTYVWTTAGYFTEEEINVLRSYQNLPPLPTAPPAKDDPVALRIRIPTAIEEVDEDPQPMNPSPTAPPPSPITPYDDDYDEAALEYQDYLEQCAYD